MPSDETFSSAASYDSRPSLPTNFIHLNGNFLSSAENRAEHAISTFRRRSFSRSQPSDVSTADLPLKKNARGIATPVGIFCFTIKLIIPVAYIYLFLVILRQIYQLFAQMMLQSRFLSAYVLPMVACISNFMKKSRTGLEVWLLLEALFFIYVKMVILVLRYKKLIKSKLHYKSAYDT